MADFIADDPIETLTIGVRADTQAFAADAASLRASLEGALGTGTDRAAAQIERGLARAVASGKLGFQDLEKVALAALSTIAAHAIEGGLSALLGGAAGSGGGVGAGSGGGGLVSIGTTLIGSLLGLPGRATGGPVSPGRGYVVGERGPELFVPTSAGAIQAAAAAAPRDVRVSITVQAPTRTEPRALARSSRQVARAVAAALAEAER